MEIKWLGTASVMVRQGKNKILFDPYMRKLAVKSPPFPVDEIRGADGVFITHAHLDHYSDMPELLKYLSCPVYTDERGAEIARRNGFYSDAFSLISVGEEVKIGEMTIKAYRARHISYDLFQVVRSVSRALFLNLSGGIKLAEINSKYRIKRDEVTAYYVRAENKEIFILGSAGLDENTEYPRGMDLLIYPYQGRNNMKRYSLKLVGKLNPKRIILDHFDDAFPPLSSETDADGFISACDIPTTKAKYGEWEKI